jgi:thiamine-monophosphate kinase
MSLSEFEIIARYFDRPPELARPDVLLGVGDDAALVRVPPEMDLVLCMDTLVAGVHFPEETTADAIGHKALAVNLSDLAAMGAEAAWITLSLTLPVARTVWLDDFARGLFALAEQYHAQLVGGDISRGPLSVTLQAHGMLPHGQALRRAGARAGDRIYVTGTLGDAGLGLRLWQAGEKPDHPAYEYLLDRLQYPQPRIAEGIALRGLASAAIDISDGLLADLGHLLEYDAAGATLWVDRLPRSAAFNAVLQTLDGRSDPLRHELPLTAGDDYELCFTVPSGRCGEVERALAVLPGGCTEIGVVEERPGIRCLCEDGRVCHPAGRGYDHFRGADPR